MVRLGRLKSGFALLLLLHLLVHPAIHVLRLPELVASSTEHTLVRQDAAAPDDVCSLCRVANALHLPVPAPAPGQLLLQAGIHKIETPSAPRTAEWSQKNPRAPPAFAEL
jgi:hypothetical protein